MVSVQEWNSKRETTEKEFEVDQTTTPWMLLTLVLVPFGIHRLIKNELESSELGCANDQLKAKGTL